MDVADCSSNPSSEEDDSRFGPCQAGEDNNDRPNKNKIYKPKFHTLQGESTEERDSSPSPDVIDKRLNRYLYRILQGVIFVFILNLRMNL